MPQALALVLKPRKSPVQSRSIATVEAIAEATIQVLLSQGGERLTTTRVAERAGVSVGTLYQYYPNKRALLCAVLEDHLGKVSTAVEAACRRSRGKPLADLVEAVVDAYVDTKMERADISTALYRIAGEIDGPAIARRMAQRAEHALEATLKTVPGADAPLDNFVIQTMYAAMVGATRSVLDAGASRSMAPDLRLQLVMLCGAYLTAAMAATSA